MVLFTCRERTFCQFFFSSDTRKVTQIVYLRKAMKIGTKVIFHIFLKCLVQPLYFSHGTLYMQRAHILPVLLQRRYQEIDSQEYILSKIIFTHTNMTNCNRQAQHLFHLEFDGAFDVFKFVLKFFTVRHHSWELASLVQPRTKQSRNLFDEGVRCNERIILLG